jgi:hypothetical protein
MTMFEVGDRVHLKGASDVTGAVIGIHPQWSYPIEVAWDNDKKQARAYHLSQLCHIPVVDRLAGLADD